MNTKSILAAVFCIVIQTAFSQHAADTTHAKKTTTKILLEQSLTKIDLENNMVRMETVVFPPAYSARTHVHPCPLFIYVLEGELLSEFDGKKKIYKVGDTFYEKANGLHSVTTNTSNTKPTKILIVYLMKEGMNTFIPH